MRRPRFFASVFEERTEYDRIRAAGRELQAEEAAILRLRFPPISPRRKATKKVERVAKTPRPIPVVWAPAWCE